MKKTILFIFVLLILSESLALAVVYTGAMDNRSSFSFIPGFTGQSRAWVTGGDAGAGLRLEWQVDNETTPGSWTYTYRMVRNTKQNKGFGFFDIETAADFTAANMANREVLSATNAVGNPLPSGLASITISDPINFNQVHDFSNAAVTEANSATVLSKTVLSHYSGDPGRVPPGVAGGSSSATPSVGPVPHPFYGIRVTFPGSFATLTNLGYDACEWSFRVVTDRVPMWGRFFGWGDQTTVSPFWYSNFFNNHIDDSVRLALSPANSLTGADPYQGWILVPGPLPSVLSTFPSAGAVTVPVSEPVSVVFSGVMDPATITTGTFTLTNISGTVSGSVIYDQADAIATFIPDNPLAATTAYTASISGARDLAGNILPPASWNFTTGAQGVAAPTVIATRPGGGASFVAVDSPVMATFSEEIDPLTLAANFRVNSGVVPVAGTVSFIPVNRTAIFTPSAPLANNTSYNATLSTGIRDRAGNQLVVPVSWTFTTIPVDTVLPFVTATVPPSPGPPPIVQRTTPITATFNKPMDATTFSGATFKLSTGGTPVTGTVTYDSASNTATFTPDAPLAFSTSYSASLTTAVHDLAGNHLPLVRGWNFSSAAQDIIQPTVTATTPVDGASNVSTAVSISSSLSEQVDPVTVGPATITVSGQRYASSASFAVTGTVTLVSSGLTLPSVNFSPTGPLPLGTVYNVTAAGVKDLAGNQMVDKIWSFTTAPDGILIPGETATTINDALRALRIAVNLVQATQDDKNHGDVAPLGAGNKPNPDGKIDINDALLLLRKTVGLISF